MGGTNVGENISSKIETLLASSSPDTKMKSQCTFHEDLFPGISFATEEISLILKC